MKVIEMRPGCVLADHRNHGACFNCCNQCNYDTHRCHFCGSDLTHDSMSREKNKQTGQWEWKRHWLSDCRPDLVAHEPGPLCTWSFRTKEFMQQLLDEGQVELYEHYLDQPLCYAFQNRDQEWTNKHEHFYTDGPMA